jgi:hypothetical protein
MHTLYFRVSDIPYGSHWLSLPVVLLIRLTQGGPSLWAPEFVVPTTGTMRIYKTINIHHTWDTQLHYKPNKHSTISLQSAASLRTRGEAGKAEITPLRLRNHHGLFSCLFHGPYIPSPYTYSMIHLSQTAQPSPDIMLALGARKSCLL